jgi:ring-1,2-phenylacetyl-CoA epoxidase subunit PaaE
MLKQRFADRLEVHYVYSREDGGVLKGRIDDHCLTRLEMQGMKWNGKAYFLCGPSDMITNVSKALETRGIAPDQIRYELFTTPAPTEYESGEQEPAEEELAEGNPVAKVRILLDDDETEIELKKDGASVLDAAIKAGIDPPYSCKGAVCTTCMAKVLSGKVRMDMNHALSDGELDEGYVLTCQSHPVSDEVSISYDEV